MPRNVRAAAMVVERSIGFGALSGAGLGVAGLVVLSVDPGYWDSAAEILSYALLAAPFAAVIGAVMGGFVGFICGLLLAVAGPTARGERRTVRTISSVAAGSPFVFLAALASENGAQGWELGGWLWWLVVAAMASATGVSIGPHVVGGRADPLTPGHSWLRHCHFRGRVVPG